MEVAVLLPQPMQSRHEVLVQQLRRERKGETQRLQELKAKLQAMLTNHPGNVMSTKDGLSKPSTLIA